MVNEAAVQATKAGHDVIALSLAKTLAKELAAGVVELPGFPDVATHVQRILADEDVTPLRVVRAVSAEPVLAGRIIQCANSVIFSPGGRQVLELRSAIARVGLDFVRTLTISFAVGQLRALHSLRTIEPQLRALWMRSVTVSTLSFVIARRLARTNADTALLAGLLHSVGTLFIQTRAAAHPELLADPAAFAAVEQEWGGNIAHALLESWHVPEGIIEAIDALSWPECELAGPVGLADLLRAAVTLERAQRARKDAGIAICSSHACARLGLSAPLFASVVEESEAEIAALRAMLGC